MDPGDPALFAGETMPKKVTARTAIRLHFARIFFLTSGTLGLPLSLFVSALLRPASH